MSNDIRICDKCRHIKMKSFLPKVKKLDPEAEIKIGCKSYCGHCTKRVFIYVNGRYITAPTEDEAIEKAKPFIK
ncbi:YuzB family protein [Paenibacillus sp. ACRRX]|uniref:DUF1450 domain-containing protein n=1 Tax=Paenibacillus TaxID=44249 RepID=UPI0004200047|nr:MULTISPECIES: DUF1450 domain-containing protein [Paenibacillus]MCG7405989.1 YuzB family protein [Paenibacillus sp. ACRRX]MDK8182442.1 DUF1450 domain-containing protein [Paenibacillus sp. UMB4589-SE434]